MACEKVIKMQTPTLGWLCPRCGAVNAPHVEQCFCKKADTEKNNALGSTEYQEIGKAPLSMKEMLEKAKAFYSNAKKNLNCCEAPSMDTILSKAGYDPARFCRTREERRLLEQQITFKVCAACAGHPLTEHICCISLIGN